MASSKPRIFHLEWNNAKLPIKDHDTRYGMKDCEGVQFANGVTVLDIGVVYETMSQMEHHLGWHGNYTLTFEPEAIEESDHAQTA